MNEIPLYQNLFLHCLESFWTEHICPRVTPWLPIIRLHLQAQSGSCFVAATTEMWQSDINNPGSREASLHISLGSSHGLHSNGALGSIINLACWPFQTLALQALCLNPHSSVRSTRAQVALSSLFLCLFSQKFILYEAGFHLCNRIGRKLEYW